METAVAVSISVSAAAPLPQLYRQPHDIEMRRGTTEPDVVLRAYRGDGNHDGQARQKAIDTGKTIPEVYRLLPSHAVSLRPDFVWMWRWINDHLSDEIFCTLLADDYAWTNNTGMPGRKNVILGKNLDQPDPAYDQPRGNGGGLYAGKIQDEFLYIESILTTQPCPEADWVLARPWLWDWGTEVAPNGNVTYITRRALNGLRMPVRVPRISRYPLYVLKTWVDELPAGFIPSDARWMPS